MVPYMKVIKKKRAKTLRAQQVVPSKWDYPAIEYLARHHRRATSGWRENPLCKGSVHTETVFEVMKMPRVWEAQGRFLEKFIRKSSLN